MTDESAPATDGTVPSGSDGEGELHRRMRRLEMLTLTLALALAGVLGWTFLGSSDRHEVLTAERLEIVEPDGQPAFVLSNSERPVTGTFDGKVLMADQTEERAMPAFIFFDGHGDEVGGMLFGNEESGDGFYATRHLSLDGYRQDQTVQLFHQQTPDGANSGLVVFDRPEERSLLETFSQLGLEPGFTRGEADSAIAAAVESLSPETRADTLRTLFGVNRLFLGSSGEDVALLTLRDGEGRPRILLGAPEAGDPYIRILDEEGEVVAGLP